MSNPNKSTPMFDGIHYRPFQIEPSDEFVTTSNLTNAIPQTIKCVEVQTVANNSDDWITLPSLADVPIGHEIVILCNAGGAFEMRTPAASAEEINSEDSDGTKEYLCTDTEIIKVVKISNAIGWMAHAYSAVGAVVTAVVPHS